MIGMFLTSTESRKIPSPRWSTFTRFRWTLFALFLALAFCSNSSSLAQEAEIEFFEKKIRPVLIERCYKCHSAESKKLKGKFLLDSREGLLKGGETGPAIVAGKPEKSLLISALRYEDLEMPPKNKLSADPRDGKASKEKGGIDVE